MPLCSLHLAEETKQYLREVPLNKDCITDDIPYQTKVEIYDEKCSGCGFAKIMVSNRMGNRDNYTSDKINVRFSTNIIELALKKAKNLGDSIIRTCEYPADIGWSKSYPVYPSIHEIIGNTCKFWRESKLYQFEYTEEEIEQCRQELF